MHHSGKRQSAQSSRNNEKRDNLRDKCLLKRPCPNAINVDAQIYGLRPKPPSLALALRAAQSNHPPFAAGIMNSPEPAVAASSSTTTKTLLVERRPKRDTHSSTTILQDTIISSTVRGAPLSQCHLPYFGYDTCEKTLSMGSMDVKKLYPVANISLIMWRHLLPPIHPTRGGILSHDSAYSNPANHTLDVGIMPKSMLTWLCSVYDSSCALLGDVRDYAVSGGGKSDVLSLHFESTFPWTLYLSAEDCEALNANLVSRFAACIPEFGILSSCKVEATHETIVPSPQEEALIFEMDVDPSDSLVDSGALSYESFPNSSSSSTTQPHQDRPTGQYRSNKASSAQIQPFAADSNVCNSSAELSETLSFLLSVNKTTTCDLWRAFFSDSIVLRAMYVHVITHAPIMLVDSVHALVPSCGYAAAQMNASIETIDVAPLLNHIVLAATTLSVISPATLAHKQSPVSIICPIGNIVPVHMEQYMPMSLMWETSVSAVANSALAENSSMASRPCLVPRHESLCLEIQQRSKQRVTVDDVCSAQWTRSSSISLPKSTFGNFMAQSSYHQATMSREFTRFISRIGLVASPVAAIPQKAPSVACMLEMLRETFTTPVALCGNVYSTTAIVSLLDSFYVSNSAEWQRNDHGGFADSVTCHLTQAKSSVFGASGRLVLTTMTSYIPPPSSESETLFGRRIHGRGLRNAREVRIIKNAQRLIHYFARAIIHAKPITQPVPNFASFSPHAIKSTNIVSLTLSSSAADDDVSANLFSEKFEITPSLQEMPVSPPSVEEVTILPGSSYTTLANWLSSNGTIRRMSVQREVGATPYVGPMTEMPLANDCGDLFEIDVAKSTAEILLERLGISRDGRRSCKPISVVLESSCVAKLISMRYPSIDCTTFHSGNSPPCDVYREICIQAILSLDEGQDEVSYTAHHPSTLGELVVSCNPSSTRGAFAESFASGSPPLSSSSSSSTEASNIPIFRPPPPTSGGDSAIIRGKVVVDASRICPLLGYTVQGATIALLLPLYNQGNFFSHISNHDLLLRRHSKLPPRKTMSPFHVIRICRDMLHAATFLAARGLSHGDVSPLNVFLDNEFNGHLGDFGMATVIGTPRWNSFGSAAFYPMSFPGEDTDNSGFGPFKSNFDDFTAVGVLMMYLFSPTPKPPLLATGHVVGTEGEYCNIMYGVCVGDTRLHRINDGSIHQPCRVCHIHNEMIGRMSCVPSAAKPSPTDKGGGGAQKSFSGFGLFVDAYRGDAGDASSGVFGSTVTTTSWGVIRRLALRLAHTIIFDTYIVNAVNNISKRDIGRSTGMSLNMMASFLCTAEAILSLMTPSLAANASSAK